MNVTEGTGEPHLKTLANVSRHLTHEGFRRRPAAVRCP